MISLAVVATEPRAAAVAQEYRLLRDLRYSDARNCALVPDNHGALGLRLTPDCERAIDRRRDRRHRRRGGCCDTVDTLRHYEEPITRVSYVSIGSEPSRHPA